MRLSLSSARPPVTLTEEEEEEIYLAQNQQIKCKKNKSYTIQLSRVTGKPEGQLFRSQKNVKANTQTSQKKKKMSQEQ